MSSKELLQPTVFPYCTLSCVTKQYMSHGNLHFHPWGVGNSGRDWWGGVVKIIITNCNSELNLIADINLWMNIFYQSSIAHNWSRFDTLYSSRRVGSNRSVIIRGLTTMIFCIKIVYINFFQQESLTSVFSVSVT
jgi:hypothetical protein